MKTPADSALVRPESPATSRVFFAVWPEPEAARRLHAVGRKLHRTCGGRVMRMETLHLTLAFLGNQTVDRVERLLELGHRIRFSPFELRIDRLGCWMHNRIVWAGAAAPAPALVSLAAALRKTLVAERFPVEKRSFTPHVTLLRKIVHGHEETDLQPIPWIVREFVLMASQTQPEGARYRVLGRWSAKA